MPSQDMSLEELGLLQLLEKISGNAGAAIDRFAHYGLVQAGLITEGEPPRLTESGVAKLEELRREREAPMPAADPDPTPA